MIKFTSTAARGRSYNRSLSVSTFIVPFKTAEVENKAALPTFEFGPIEFKLLIFLTSQVLSQLTQRILLLIP